MRRSLRLVLPLALASLTLGACRSTSPALSDPAAQADDAELTRLRTENERLRRLAETGAEAADCPDPEVARRGETVEELLTDELFFESGSADLTDAGRERIGGLARRLDRDYRGRRVRVEGHTDTQPIGPTLRVTYPTNWELSTARATQVVRALQDAGLAADRLEAVGMGAYYPAGSNATADGRARNRRVRVAVLPE